MWNYKTKGIYFHSRTGEKSYLQLAFLGSLYNLWKWVVKMSKENHNIFSSPPSPFSVYLTDEEYNDKIEEYSEEVSSSNDQVILNVRFFGVI